MLKREAIYLWFYFSVQFEQIFSYWIWGMAIGSFVSVFCKDKIHSMFIAMQGRKFSLFGIIPACLLGIASPLCMYGTIPIAASFSEKGMRDDWLASFMMASILLNPQLIIYSAALGRTALIVRVLSCFFCGIAAGVFIHFFYNGKNFFDFTGFHESSSHDTDPNILLRYVKNFGRNVKTTGFWFLHYFSVTFRLNPSQDFSEEKTVSESLWRQLSEFPCTFAEEELFHSFSNGSLTV